MLSLVCKENSQTASARPDLQDSAIIASIAEVACECRPDDPRDPMTWAGRSPSGRRMAMVLPTWKHGLDGLHERGRAGAGGGVSGLLRGGADDSV